MIWRVLILLCSTFTLLSAQGTTAGYDALNLPFIARSAALGDAGVADPSSILSAQLNPALLAVSPSATFALSHQRWFQDVTSNSFFAAFPVWGFHAGVRVFTTAVRGIEIREIPGPPLGTFDAQTAAIGALVAFPYGPDALLGISVNHVYEKILVDEASSVLFDVGGLYKTPIEGLTAGLSLRHFGTSDAMRARRSRLPTEARVGIAYAMQFDDLALRSMAGLATQNGQPDPRIQLGAEGLFADMLSIRIGYQTGYTARGLSAGVGITHDVLFFDYAFLPTLEGLGHAHIITLGIVIPS